MLDSIRRSRAERRQWEPRWLALLRTCTGLVGVGLLVYALVVSYPGPKYLDYALIGFAVTIVTLVGISELLRWRWRSASR